MDLPESMGSVTAPSVIVIDRVLLPAREAGSWLDRLRAEYAPGACQRGMRLADTWWCYVDPDAIEVTVRWELPDVASFWVMRHAARTDRLRDEVKPDSLMTEPKALVPVNRKAADR